MTTTNTFPTLWEAKAGKYLTIKIQQGKKGNDDLILYINQLGHKPIWQAVDRAELLRAFNSVRREPIQLEAFPINNERQLRYAIRHALYDVIQRSAGYQDLYHDLPNVLIGIAESEHYLPTVITRKNRKLMR